MAIEVTHKHKFDFDTPTQLAINRLAEAISSLARALGSASSSGAGNGESDKAHDLRDIRDRLEAVHRKVESLTILANVSSEKETQFMASLQQMQAKIDEINANTTASAQAAGALSTTLQEVRDQLAALQLSQNTGMSAEEEDTLLGKLDAAVQLTGNLRSNLEQTASSPTSPEPPPVVVPPDLTGEGGTTGTGTTETGSGESTPPDISQ